ncbi:amidohydrolase family protein [Klebsiella pneumoniae]|uniref:Amidohydrolase family protein n=1 Tax=Klebsiella pneumoniae TaxID=573 RepID=A0A2X3HK13_KLEPN|nr:amidohydrolase family protein [Klebsiella pneumoniae]
MLRNDPATNAMVREVATALFGAEQVGEVKPFMGSEDLPSCWSSTRMAAISPSAPATKPDRCMVHNPGYDFNDALLLTGAALWCGLTERYLR